jgi:hypothetical protein
MISTDSGNGGVYRNEMQTGLRPSNEASAYMGLQSGAGC